MEKACRMKFRSDPVAREFLVNTEDCILAEAGPNTVWGTGLKLLDDANGKKDSWKGQNLLGTILMKIRDELQQTIPKSVY